MGSRSIEVEGVEDDGSDNVIDVGIVDDEADENEEGGSVFIVSIN